MRRTRSYSYERCDRCYGLWLSLGVLTAMVSEMKPPLGVQFTQRPGRATRSCPDCQAPLAPVGLVGIPVDHCPNQHGVWFDKDELGQVLDRVSDPSLPPPAPPTSFTSLLEELFRI